VAKKINVKGKNQSSSIKGMVKAYLTEDLEWKKKPLCLYHKLQSDELVYLAGSIKHCIVERENIETFLNFPKLKNLTNTARKLEAQTKIKNKQDGSVGGIKSKNFDYLLTLNPNIQLSLNSLEICFEDSVRCDTTILRIDQLEGISIVLIDPFTSGIIGVKCMGSFCSENGLKPLGDLATLRVRSPPASISKLFFGLGIASEGNNNTVEILNQLKTSGNNQSPSGKRILRKIKTLKKPFLLYAPQAFREVNYLLRSDICMGHIYVEEGQLAYTKIKEFIPKQVSLLDNFLRNWRNRFNDKDEIGFYFRNDSSCYLGITNDSFPEINQDKKYILQNINSVKKFYKPKLIGIENIGLTCAWRRLDRKNWSKMLKILIKEMNGEGVIKLHPSFTSSKKIEEDITKVFQKLETKKKQIDN